MRVVTNTLTDLALGQPTTFLNLTLFPLCGTSGFERDYLTLHEAVRDGTAKVSEVSRGGSVPELSLENTGKQPVLILDGEELIGAKQNRTANVTILAPAGKTVRIPVTCVEAGRWSYSTPDFVTSDRVHFSKGRKSKMESVSRSMRSSGARAADQSEVWNDISLKAAAMGVNSPTGAMADVYDTHSSKLEDYVGAFERERGQVAAVFAIGARVEGLELFDCEQTLAEMLPKLVRSYAIDAIEEPQTDQDGPRVGAADSFIERLVGANVETYPAVGLGSELRLTAPGVIAGGLEVNHRIVHLAAFSAVGERGWRGAHSDGLASSRTRRRWSSR